MPGQEAERIFQEGLIFLEQGNSLAALACFERALAFEQLPVYRSYHALCIAKERGQARRAEEICRAAASDDPENPVIYLNLGRVLMMADKKPEAIEAFRSGLQCGPNEEIIRELTMLGTRKPPVLPFLRRTHPLNKYLGILFRRQIR